MLLKELLKGVNHVVIGDDNIEISGVTEDSRKVEKGWLFFAMKGKKASGENYVLEAIEKGGVAVVTENELDAQITQIIVKDLRKEISKICANFYNNPQKRLKIIGITGTNGKTTTANIICETLNKLGKTCGVIGTLGAKFNGKTIQTDMTTPDVKEFFYILSQMEKDGIKYVVTEYSAHAIYFKKLSCIKFRCLILTNVSQDHLDFFGDLENYKKVKLSIFNNKHAKKLIVNSDDEACREILKKETNVLSYGIYNPSDAFAINIEEKQDGVSFVVNVLDKIGNVKSVLMGEYNVYNLLCSLLCLVELGVNFDDTIEAINGFGGVDGRLNLVGEYNGGKVYVDFAHTPTAMEKVLTTLKNVCSGKLTVVFGAGGDRDKDKRSKMGAVATEIADYTVLTADNSRSEKVEDIIGQIQSGITDESAEYIIMADRFKAIEYGIKRLNKGDILLIAGRGGEKKQEIFGQKIDFDDSEVAKKIIKELTL